VSIRIGDMSSSVQGERQVWTCKSALKRLSIIQANPLD
jgi:hypothetical protein